MHQAVASGDDGRLADFRLQGRLGPVLAFALVAASIYAWDGWDTSFRMLLSLWVAYSINFLALAALARRSGFDAPWAAVLITAASGAVVGGLAGTTITMLPLGRAWIPAAFSAFFVGLSLVTAAMRTRERRAAEGRRLLLEARLQTLSAQIEPHFLMNTLANLRYLIKTDAAAAATMLDNLADFLEGSLERARAPHSTLGSEIKLVESYLSIMQIRLGARLRFSTEIPPDLAAVPFPPLLLQTLVENAVVHGIEPHEAAGTVTVAVSREGSNIAVRVADDGVGIDRGKRPAHGLGLTNTRERLATFYDGRASFRLAPAAPCGTVAEIRIPAEG
ncbi:MAG TPA: histidine kinase [Candidatus Polarisedimenticolaceae bacterium]|nr:histidine kinase [Candidatus Polarisedimenticolaceae bacterium]